MKGEAGDGEGLELVDEVGTGGLEGTSEGMGRIHIRSRSLLCCGRQWTILAWSDGSELTLSRSSSMRRRISFRENASAWPRFLAPSLDVSGVGKKGRREADLSKDLFARECRTWSMIAGSITRLVRQLSKICS